MSSRFTDGLSVRTSIELGTSLLFVGIATSLALVTWDAWVVNYDGGAYLALAERLRTGLGYTFPDGSPAAFRGPGYPLTFAVTWLVAPITEKTAIWTSRSFILVGSIATAGIVWFATRRALATAVSGLAAAIQPLIFTSGAFFFVPDGMAAVFILIGTAITAPGVGSRYGRWRPWAAGLILGLGTLTKETAVFGLLVVAALALNVWHRKTAQAVLSQVGVGWAIPVGIWISWVLATTGRLPAPADDLTGYTALAVLLAGLALLFGFWFIAGRNSNIASAPRTEIPVPRALVSVGLLLIVPLAVLLAVGSPTVQPVGESWKAFIGTLRGEIWGPDLVQWFVGSVVILIAAALTVRKSHRFRLFPPIALIALGLSLATWGALSEFGVRNGAILVYGLAWLLGVIVADWSGRSSAHGAWRLAAVALVGGFVWLNLAGLSFANGRVIPRTPSWDAPGIQRAADWLSENARGKTAAGTPVFLNYLSFRTSGAFDARLVPVFETDRSDIPLPLSAFDRQVWWAGHIDQFPIGTVELGRTYGAKFVSSITEEDLLEELWGSRAELMIITGTTRSPGPYEGVILVPYMEAIPWTERVYTSAVSELPYWVFIYRITDDPTPMHSPAATTYVPHPSRPYESLDGLTITGRDEYEDFIGTIVRAES